MERLLDFIAGTVLGLAGFMGLAAIALVVKLAISTLPHGIFLISLPVIFAMIIGFVYAYRKKEPKK